MSREADHFYDAVYLPSSRHLFTDALCDAEAALIASLLGPEAGKRDRLLDLGCGDGRHLRGLARLGRTNGVGLDRSEVALREGLRVLPNLELIRGDYRALPFLPGSFEAVFVWYAALFVLEDDDAHLNTLKQIFKLLAPGGRFLHDGANPRFLARDPVARFECRLPDGRFVQERCEWREAEGREHGFRRLLGLDGSVVEGAWATRHYTEAALTTLLQEAGFEVECVLNEQGEPFDEGCAQDLVILARRP